MPGLILATPALWYPGQDEAEWQAELDASIVRSIITSEFLKGNIEPDSFLDFIAEELGDPLDVATAWEEEIEVCLSNST